MREGLIVFVVVLVLAGVVLFLLGGAARAQMRDIALAPSEPTG